MEKKLEDYLHFYLPYNIKCETPKGIGLMCTYGIAGIAIGFGMNPGYKEFMPSEGIKPIFRPLSDISDGEAVELFNIGRGAHSDNKIDEVKRMATNEFYLRTGIAEYLFGFWSGHDNDVRVPIGYTFYIKRYYISEDLSVSNSGIESSPSHFTPIKNEDKIVSCKNQTELFRYLLSKGFDLFGLIEAGLAIDKTKL